MLERATATQGLRSIPLANLIAHLVEPVLPLTVRFINQLLLATRVDRTELENYDGTAVPVSF